MSTSRPFSVADDLSLALRLADIADSLTMARYQAQDLVIDTKPDLTPVTDADMAVERAIREVLQSERPDDLIVGEEFGSADLDSNLAASMHGTGKHFWVIDPIDGTKNFVRGIPSWATLIGVSTPSQSVIAGVVSAPALHRRWHAGLGLGAFVNENVFVGKTDNSNSNSNSNFNSNFNSSADQKQAKLKKLAVSKVSSLSDAQLSYSDLIGWGPRKAAFLQLQERVWRTRGFGDFWSHMLVAEGAVDIAVEPKLALWDMAALEIIVKEAGGEFTNIEGKPGSHGGSLVTSNALLHHQFIEALNG